MKEKIIEILFFTSLISFGVEGTFIITFIGMFAFSVCGIYIIRHYEDFIPEEELTPKISIRRKKSHKKKFDNVA